MIEGRHITVRGGAVAAESPEAARCGVRTLEAGGNAMDAAAAACLATAVVQPYFVDAGGYVCAGTLLEGATGRVWCVDANAVAPGAAREDMFVVRAPEPGKAGINENEYDCTVSGDANIYGPLAVATPGFLAGIGTIAEKWGRLGWGRIVNESLDLIDRGFAYGRTAQEIDKRLAIIMKDAATQQLLLPSGKPPHPDDVWHRTDLARTLRRLASAGWRDFYDGEIGRRIGDHVSAIGGILTRDDMAAFAPRVTGALDTTYRGAAVHGPILPHGALSVLQILNMLECFGARPLDDLHYWHRLAEILKLAWRDRLRYLADPAFADVPAAMLLDKEYAAHCVKPIREFPNHVGRTATPPPSASPHGTAHVSAADADGNVVSVTISQGNPFGSCVTVPGLGFVLGHGMCRLDPRPGRPNSIAPAKRPLNNVCPLLIRTADRDVAVGLRGGRRIVSAVAQIAHRVIDYGMSPRDLATAGRIHTLEDEPIEIDVSFPLPLQERLAMMGHAFRPVDEVGGPTQCADFTRATRVIRAGGLGAAGF